MLGIKPTKLRKKIIYILFGGYYYGISKLKENV